MLSSADIRRGYVAVHGRNMHYRQAGDPSLPTVLLLHQSPSSSAMYELLMSAMAQSYHLLAPDTPGFGGSDLLTTDIGNIGIGDYALAIKGFLAALKIENCYVFGHHTGAGIAVQVEHDFPGTAIAMALSGPPLLSESQKKSLPELASPIEVMADGSHLQAMWQRISAKDPDAPVQLLQREVQSAFDCGDSYLASYQAITRQPFARQLTSINCPVLVYAGDSDPLYLAVEPTVELLPRAQRAWLSGGERTYVCERRVDLIAPLLEDFFGLYSNDSLSEDDNGS